MNDVVDSIMDARQKALESWLADNEVTTDELGDKYGVDVDVLPNGDEKFTLFEKVTKDTTVVSYKVSYGKQQN